MYSGITTPPPTPNIYVLKIKFFNVKDFPFIFMQYYRTGSEDWLDTYTYQSWHKINLPIKFAIYVSLQFKFAIRAVP